MKTTLTSLAAITVAFTVPLAAQERPKDFSPEPSLLELRAQLHDQVDRLTQKHPDKALIPGDVPEDAEEWDMVRRLEKQRQDQSEDAMIRRLMKDAGLDLDLPDSDQGHRMEAPPWIIGLSIEPIDPFLRSHLSIPGDAGARITMVMEGGPAAQAGVLVDDIVVRAGKQKVHSLESLQKAVLKSGREGRPLELELIRKGKPMVVSVQPRGPEPKPGANPSGSHPLERRLSEMEHRLDQQQREIEMLRRQISGMKPGKMQKRKKEPRGEAIPRPESR